MSAKYTFLAWETPVNDASTKLALLQLANNADDHGFSYYSISKMAKACDMSERNFMRKIKKLESLKVLKVERRSNRSSLYTLIGDEMGVTICHLQQSEVTGCHAEVTGCHLVGDSVSHDPNSTPNINPKSIVRSDQFEKFWDLYDKKTSRVKCEPKFNKLSENDIELIFKVLPDYIKSTPDKKYRKDPQTWLNGKCWNDEIEHSEPTINYMDVINAFNDSMRKHKEVPKVIDTTPSRIRMIDSLVSNRGMNIDGFKGYFQYIAKNDNLQYFINGIKTPARGIDYFINDDVFIKIKEEKETNR